MNLASDTGLSHIRVYSEQAAPTMERARSEMAQTGRRRDKDGAWPRAAVWAVCMDLAYPRTPWKAAPSDGRELASPLNLIHPQVRTVSRGTRASQEELGS